MNIDDMVTFEVTDANGVKRKCVALYGSDVPNFWKALAQWLIEERG